MKQQKQQEGSFYRFQARFGAFFILLISIFFFWSCVLEPAAFTWRSRDWRATPCLISRRSDSSGNKRVVFAYTVEGRKYTGDRLSSSDVTTKHRSWTRRFPEGAKEQCFVNPRMPQEAVLTWGWSWQLVPFALLSVLLMGMSIKNWRHPEQVNSKRKRNPRQPENTT